MKFKKLFGALTASLIFSAGGSHAAAIYLDGPAGQTENFAAFGLGEWQAVSTYADANTNGQVDPGEFVVDTVSQNYSSGGVSIANYWGNMTLEPAVFDAAGFGTTWGLFFDYTLNGQVISATGSSILAYYYSGTIDIYYDDYVGRASGNAARSLSDPKVMSIDVTGSGGDIANFLLYGKITDVASDLFFFSSGVDFDTLIGNDVQIDLRVDTNLDTDQVPTGANGVLSRTSALDGSARFEIPEPGVLALLGLGFAGLGFARRNKKQS